VTHKSLLFVDDEPNILLGLKRMLRPMHAEWDMCFAENGKAALELLESTPCDVIISDMRMPGMDGAELLAEVTKRYPAMVRIVLSGQSDKEAIFRAIGVAHQYLAKPCGADTLKSTVARACALREVLGNPAITRAVSRLSQLPSLPAIYRELIEELQSESPELSRIAELIGRDVAMTAKILQVVNSAYFGARRKVTTTAQAVSYLGLENLSALVLAANIFSQLEVKTTTSGFSMEALWEHSNAVGHLARRIMKEEKRPKHEFDAALTAGLLHDCGKLVLAANTPKEYGDVLLRARDDGRPLLEVEREMLGASHAEIGAYLLSMWGLPDPIIEAVAFHHEPSMCQSTALTYLTAVHVANALRNAASAGAPKEERTRAIDAHHLETLGLASELPRWCELLDEQEKRAEC
jgi:putative nucleotidyltransferase with HDIG domain